jgi:hypothetical protein
LDNGTVAVSNLVTIYNRRLHHLRERRIRFIGDDTVDRLQDAGVDEVAIAVVPGPETTSSYSSHRTAIGSLVASA